MLVWKFYFDMLSFLHNIICIIFLLLFFLICKIVLQILWNTLIYFILKNYFILLLIVSNNDLFKLKMARFREKISYFFSTLV